MTQQEYAQYDGELFELVSYPEGDFKNHCEKLLEKSENFAVVISRDNKLYEAFRETALATFYNVEEQGNLFVDLFRIFRLWDFTRFAAEVVDHDQYRVTFHEDEERCFVVVRYCGNGD